VKVELSRWCWGRDRGLEADLKQLETVLAGVGLACEVHLSPLAHSSAIQVLSSSDYTKRIVLGTETAFLDGRGSEESKAGITNGVIVAEAARNETEEGLEASIVGFQDNGRSRELLDALTRIVTTKDDTRLYLAKIDNRIAGNHCSCDYANTHGKDSSPLPG
jgi:hypothetical protein